MEVLQYPIDSVYIINSKKKIKHQLEMESKPKIQKKIAILGGSTTQEIVNILELFLLNNGINPIFYQSEYNHYWQDGVFSNPELDTFDPDIIYIHTSHCNIESYPVPFESKQDANDKLQVEFNRFKTMWESLQTRFACPVIQNNMERPCYRLMGNKDISALDGKTNFISRLNQLFYAYSQNHSQFFIHDIDYLASEYGLSRWHDPRAWYSYKYCLAINAIPEFAFSLANIIKSIFGFNKKVITLDLDNTLWGGVIGEDGREGISIGPELPMGQIYSDFQYYLKQLKTIGILLTIASKNDECSAKEGFSHPDMILKMNDFVAHQINWNRKDMNIQQMANSLQIGFESIVFVDDNPAERQIVSSHISNVDVVPYNDIENFIPYLDKSGFFETTIQTGEDQKRSEMYIENKTRQDNLIQFANYQDYLLSLNMTATMSDFNAIDLQRIVQLTNKTNQFNLTTIRYTDGDMRKIVHSNKYIRICGRLKDKYGDNGIVSLMIAEKQNNSAHIILWLMSCRVLKRDMEYAMMDTFVKRCKDESISQIYGEYIPTTKNTMTQYLYRDMGFELQEDLPKKTVWRLSVDSYQQKNKYIRIEHQ